MLNIHSSVHYARTLPAAFYREASYFERSVESIFLNSWQFVCHESETPGEGSAYPFLFLDPVIPEPLVLLQNSDHGKKVVSNVCTHRGNILVDQPSKLKEIVCRYHGRRFDLNGCFKSMPMSKGMKDFPSEKDHLPAISLVDWHGFQFAALQPSFDFFDWIKVVEDKVCWMPFHLFKPVSSYSKSYTVNAHWALYIDNYLEGFHIPFVHPELNATIDMGTYETIPLDHGVLQIAYAREGELRFDIPENATDYGKSVAAYYFWLFPNLMLNFYPWGLSVNIVRPVSLEKTMVDYRRYVWKPELMGEGAGSDLDLVEQQDEAIVEQVQRGIKSMLYHSGRFSPVMESGVHRFHSLVAEFLNK